MPFLTTAAIVGGTLAAGIGGAAISAHAAGKAADTQANAAMSAEQLQKQEADNSLAFQKQQWTTEQQNLAPWLQSGKEGLANLDYLLGVSPNPQQAGRQFGQPGQMQPSGNPPQMIRDPRTGQMMPAPQGAFTGQGTPRSTTLPGGGIDLNSLVNPSLGGYGSLLTPFGEQFTAPTNVTEQNDPGYQFRLDQGMKALSNSASAKGTLLNGGTGKDITQFGQNYASNEYGNVYSRAKGEYDTRYNQYQQSQADKYNRLAGLSGVGQTAANTLGQQGQAAASNVSNINLTAGQQQGQDINNAGAARASGIVGGANAWSSGLGSLASLGYLPMLMQQQQAAQTPTNWQDWSFG